MAEPLPIYDQIDRPYDSFLSRDTTQSVSGLSSSDVETQIDSGGLVKTGAALNDVWLDSWMKSRNYQPKTQGFLIDARLGYIEAMKLFIGSGGIVGGSLDIPNQTTTNSFHVESDGDTFWGTTNALFTVDNTNAPAYVLKTGDARFSNVVITGTSTVGGRLATIIGGALDVNGDLINDVVNTQFDTSTKSILGDFTFGVSGAIKMITDANNGLWISPTGILGKNAGVTTFAVDTAGNASFRGNVVITGGSGIASLSDAGNLAVLDSIGASNVDSTIISGGKIITGLLTASNIQTGTLNASLVTVTNLTSASITSGTITIGGTDQPSSLVIKATTISGNARLSFENSSRIWEDSSGSLGYNSYGSGSYQYFYCHSDENVVMRDADQTIFRYGVSCRGPFNVGVPNSTTYKARFTDGCYFDSTLATAQEIWGGSSQMIYNAASYHYFNINTTEKFKISAQGASVSNGLFYIMAMSGATATGFTAQNGAMYYKTDDNTLRMYGNGSWQTVFTF
ncbi:MAG: hypothetical protein WCX88_01840 [Patescibacteria group bacterium]